jgi:hypothetical protein
MDAMGATIDDVDPARRPRRAARGAARRG